MTLNVVLLTLNGLFTYTNYKSQNYKSAMFSSLVVGFMIACTILGK